MTELKELEKETPKEEVQPEKKPESGLDSEAQVAVLEEELAKQKEEKDNYKQGVLSKQEEIKKLKAQVQILQDTPPVEKVEDKEPEQELEPKEKEKKEEAPKEDIPKEAPKTEGYNPETEARAQFARKYPDAKMSDVLVNYRGGSYETVTEYMEALEDAKEFTDFKAGKSSSENVSGMASQAGGVSETENKSKPRVTAKDVEQAKKYFDGNVDRYLRAKELKNK